ncbi:MAG: glycosyltransferase [Methanobrevibacter sp.]|uniref:glycosyltransferase family 2 protein n=1 Tax=Methanobrevibacter sp. TaxID=66852 RepID=UPI002E75A691|nr:glycosyltransferase [Methanobrevibacter sp.]MEE0942209.1 glycosyltransferase [Methanobrevibacter sp.]
MKYKISIIIPVYNAEEFIIDTLHSIENQTMDFEDIEIILVNDCSSDNTAVIIDNYAKNHSNIIHLPLKDNAGGPAIPRNIGITYASADYLMFLDQDDVFKDDACEVLYDKIVKNNVDMVCGNHNMVHNGMSNLCFNFDWADSDEIKIKNIYENPNFLTMGVAAWSKIFKRDFILKNNIKFTEGVGEDIFFSIRALLMAEGIILLKNFAVVDYQIRDESLSHQVDYDYVVEFCDFYSSFYEYCINNKISDELYLPLFNGRMNNLLSILFYPNLEANELASIFSLVQPIFLGLYEKSFYFFNNHYELFYRFLIKDEYPFKQSISIYNFIKRVRSNQLIKDLKKIELKCKIYIDTGNGFNENETIQHSYDRGGFNAIDFDVSNYKNIVGIRFDPLEENFIKCNIIEFKSDFGQLSFKTINSIGSIDSNDLFLTNDPQYLVLDDIKDINNIQIKFLVSFIDNVEITNIINSNLLENLMN